MEDVSAGSESEHSLSHETSSDNSEKPPSDTSEGEGDIFVR